MSGVEGYVESAASGLVAGIAASFRARGEEPPRLPRGHGSRRPRPLHRAQRPEALPADEHRVRPAARAARARPGQGEEAAGDDALGRSRASHASERARCAGSAARSAAPEDVAARGLRRAPRDRGVPAPPRARAQRLAAHDRGLRRGPRTVRGVPRGRARPPGATAGRRPPADPRLPGRAAPRGLKKSSSARKLAALRTFFRYLCREGRLRANPAQLLLTPRREQRIPSVLEEPQVERLLDVPGEGLAASRAPGDPRAALRDGDPLRGARRARHGRGRPRGPHPARTRQGSQGAAGAVRRAGA